MNLNTGLLIFAMAYLVIAPWLILIPWLRGSHDLITARNLFIAGTLQYFGITVINVAGAGDDGWIIAPVESDMWRFIGGVILLMTTFLFVYHKWGWPVRRAQIQASKPVASTQGGTIYVVAVLTMIYSFVGIALPIGVPGLAQIFAVTAAGAAIFAFVIALWHWNRNRYDPIALLFVLLTGAWTVLAVLAGGSGRRDLLSLLVAVPLVFYWARLRYRNVTETAVKLSVLAVAGLLVLAVYSGIRHGIQWGMAGESGLDKAVVRVQAIFGGLASGQRSWTALSGDNSVAVSFVCFNNFAREGSPDWFYTFRFMVLNPIPRQILPSKPEGLGQTLPRDMGMWRYGYVNWGPGIIGHAYHDGGLWMCVIYGIILGGAFRWFDELLRADPENPYRLGVLAAMSPQLVGLSRGDIAIFGMQLLGSVAFGIVVVWLIKRTLGGLPSPAPHPDDDPNEFSDEFADEFSNESGHEFGDESPDGAEGSEPGSLALR